ncbi:ORF V: Enzymatic polyprotein [Labeo rohita]|uniref:ORF V: Enzymatic polyprotein n=1 Tax=Labeo rohita TaxID=84645 RepID=A0ABQ8N0P5_LABRO|nr:ORF V: Enzymatic polyprotein [Labeo rohita]
MWRKPWFLSQGPVLGAPCRRVTLATDASLTGWGAVMSGHPARGLWSGRHLSWHINCLEMLAVFQGLKHFLPDLRDRHVLVRTDNTAVVSYINHQGGLRSRPLYKLAHQILVWSQGTPLTESSFCARVSQCGSRRPVETGAEARGMDASPRGGEADLESVWSSPGGPVCHEGQCTMSPLVLSSSSSSTGAGCHGTDVAEAASVRFSPIALLPGVLERVRRDGVSLLLVAPFWPGRVWFSDLISLLDGSPWEIPVRRDLLSQAGVPSFTPGRSCGSFGAPSTRKLYALKWKLFTSWCGRRQQNPVNCPVGSVLEFLQDRLSAGLSHSTLKVYVAAIAAYHAPLGGLSVGKNPLVTRFLRGALRLRPPVRPRVPSWDLSVVLDALCLPPFEPIEEISDCHLSFKTSFLLALSSLKRVGDLQALSVAPSFLDFAPGLSKAFLHPRTGYVPKVPSFAPRPVVLQAFCPPPFREPDQQKLNCMCPVRALDAYVHRVATWRRSDQLFVCFGPQRRGLPASKQTISRWIVEAILLAYESSGLPPPLGVKAHSTRSMAASKSFLAGIPLQDICNAAGWSTPLTFVRFYRLDLLTPGSSVLPSSSRQGLGAGGVGISFP